MRALFAILLVLGFVASAGAQDAQTILHLLDYIGVDYAEAVGAGKVKNEEEYREMLEFTGKVSEHLAAMPANALSFLAVYREMFEIVLFYQALWAQAGEAGRAAVIAGGIAGAFLLAIVGLAILHYSVRLPIGPFFGATSALLALLGVIFTGHGVAALQEAGILGSTRLGFDPVALLGIYPSGEAIGAQLLAIVLVVFGFRATRRSASASAP